MVFWAMETCIQTGIVSVKAQRHIAFTPVSVLRGVGFYAVGRAIWYTHGIPGPRALVCSKKSLTAYCAWKACIIIVSPVTGKAFIIRGRAGTIVSDGAA
jgi:hypothetical protein